MGLEAIPTCMVTYGWCLRPYIVTCWYALWWSWKSYQHLGRPYKLEAIVTCYGILIMYDVGRYVNTLGGDRDGIGGHSNMFAGHTNAAGSHSNILAVITMGR